MLAAALSFSLLAQPAIAPSIDLAPPGGLRLQSSLLSGRPVWTTPLAGAGGDVSIVDGVAPPKWHPLDPSTPSFWWFWGGVAVGTTAGMIVGDIAAQSRIDLGDQAALFWVLGPIVGALGGGALGWAAANNSELAQTALLTAGAATLVGGTYYLIACPSGAAGCGPTQP